MRQNYLCRPRQVARRQVFNVALSTDSFSVISKMKKIGKSFLPQEKDRNPLSGYWKGFTEGVMRHSQIRTTARQTADFDSQPWAAMCRAVLE